MKNFFLIFLLWLTSCSTTKTGQEPIVPVPSDISIKEENPLTINENENVKPEEVEKSPIKKTSTTIFFGPGINRTVGYTSFIKGLKKQNIEIDMVSGVGMGAVFAAHMASGKTTQKMEWLYFKFFNETRGEKPFSKSWKKSLEEIFLKEFKNTEVQNLKTSLVIPVYQKNPPKIVYLNKGNLFELLKSQFIFSLKEDGPYASPLISEAFDGFFLRKLGANFIIGVDVLGKKIIFEEADSKTRKIYSDMPKKVGKDKKYFDLFFSLPFSEMPLDSDKKLPESLQKTNEYSKWAAKAIKDKSDTLTKVDEEK